MIIQQEKYDTQSNVSGTKFKIEQSAKMFEIISSSIYTNKLRAVIREVCCNAHDAHVQNNVDKPFDVTLPTYADNRFIVRDYGSGLSHEDMLTVYTTYFYSTKNEDNNTIGGLGLGSKSPLCLVKSFNVTSYHGGKKSVYTCGISATGEPEIYCMGSAESTEPSGLEVCVAIPTDKISYVSIEAIEVFKFFDSPPNINSDRVLSEIKKFKESHVVEGDFVVGGDAVYVVMGNVRYRVGLSSNDLGLICNGHIYMSNGSVGFDPGRENISLNDSSLAALKAKCSEISANIEKIIDKNMESMNEYEKFIYINTNFPKIASSTNKYPNEAFGFESRCNAIRCDSYGTFSSKGVSQRVEFRDLSSGVKYFSCKNHITTAKRKIKHLFNTQDLCYIYIFNTGDATGLPSNLVIDLDVVTLPRGQVTPRGSVKNKTVGVIEVDCSDAHANCIKSLKGVRKDVSYADCDNKVLIPHFSGTACYTDHDLKLYINYCKQHSIKLDKFYYIQHGKIKTVSKHCNVRTLKSIVKEHVLAREKVIISPNHTYSLELHEAIRLIPKEKINKNIEKIYKYVNGLKEVNIFKKFDHYLIDKTIESTLKKVVDMYPIIELLSESSASDHKKKEMYKKYL